MTLPPLLAIAKGRRAGKRKAMAPRAKEIDLHMAVADMLRRFAKPDWLWSHFPAGEHRDKRTAAKLKAMGVQRGWSDFLLFDPSGRLHTLELKREGETLTEDQKEFQTWCIRHGVPHGVAWSTNDALAILGAWSVLRLKIWDVVRVPELIGERAEAGGA